MIVILSEPFAASCFLKLFFLLSNVYFPLIILIMKSTATCLFLFFAALSFSQESNSTRFMSDPAPSPDGKTLLFAYEGDIWKMDVTGGTAYRITAMEGSESLPRYSPDGKWIAFTGTQDGNENIYVVPSSGGEIKQLTFHSSFDYTDSWSWDSEQIYFTSGRFNNFSSYRVSIHGGTPQRLFSDHYWNNAHFVVEDPAGEAYIFSESGESFRSNNRKILTSPRITKRLHSFPAAGCSYPTLKDSLSPELKRWRKKGCWKPSGYRTAKI